MFDYAAPERFAPTKKTLGVGKHPHRGFETVTIAFQGEVEHADSLGNGGVIKAGDVQWMTAARGILHEEYHSTEFAKQGGVFEMAQIWVNLPKAHKMDPPRYQPIVSADIPAVPLRPADSSTCQADGVGEVRVIAGSFDGVKGPAKTVTPIEMWDVRFRTAQVPVQMHIADGHNVMLLVRHGGLRVGKEGKQMGAAQMATFERQGELIQVTATEADTQVLLLAGEPINEPIAARGPFVMNTDAEIMQANRDFMSGKMGR